MTDVGKVDEKAAWLDSEMVEMTVLHYNKYTQNHPENSTKEYYW